MALLQNRTPGSPVLREPTTSTTPADTSSRPTIPTILPPTSPQLQQHQHFQQTRLRDGRQRPLTASANNARRQSLKRVKDNTEELRRRARSRTIETATSIGSGSSVSASAGRSFTVANLNNGILYLRPIVRPGNQRNTRPAPDTFVFPPQTPPDSAKLDSYTLRPPSNDWSESFTGSHTPPPRADTTPSPLSPPPREVDADSYSYQLPNRAPPRANPHVRSHSFSTIDERASVNVEPGTFKVVIERPTYGRPKTADTSLPFLQVPIPHYRLGTPRFSARGTAMLRSSVYTRGSGTPGTEDFRSSIFTPQRATHSFMSSKGHSGSFSGISRNNRLTADKLPPQSSSSLPSAGTPNPSIGPHLYDALTPNPDDESLVRFSPSGEIMAATPSRLVAHITSPSFLDYELLSDFFLTFRSFLNSRELVAYLISRLQWAVGRQDDFGRIVRVRTFVALRHWILNYFVDDFVPFYNLRAYFCDLVNVLYDDLKARADKGGGDIKIVGELKKCWRRTCAIYWDIEGVGNDCAESPLLPGGHVESNASLEETPVSPSRRRPSAPHKLETIGSNPSDQFTTKHSMDWPQRSRHTPQNSLSSPYIPAQENGSTQAPLSPGSEISMPVLSCSFPMRGLHKESNTERPLHSVPHPIPVHFVAGSQYSASINRPNRPSHSHKRSGSFSDALRDNRAPLSIPKNAPPDGVINLVSKMPGTLIRGGLFQPGSPYIDTKSGSLRHAVSHVNLEQPEGKDSQARLGHSPNPGMKKLLGTVRRALSSKQPSTSMPYLPTSPQFQAQISPRTSNIATVSTSSAVVHKRRYPRSRMQTRIDVLAMKVEKSFQEALKQELQREKQAQNTTPVIGGFDFEFDRHEAAATEGPPQKLDRADPRLYSNLTAGSRSIVIMDDTGPPPLPLMSGALRFSNDDAREKEIEESDLNKHCALDSQPDIEAEPHQPEQLDEYEGLSQIDSLDWRPTSQHAAPDSFGIPKRSTSQSRQRAYPMRRRGSSKVSTSRSISLRRHASYNSGLARRNTAASVANSIRTESSDPFFLDNFPAGPARQLRRRPGGDLRGVDNVHDLEPAPRPRSTGSVSNRTHSISNSVILRADKYTEPTNERIPQEVQLSEAEPPKKPISLVNTHSSQPNLRPSFEAEVAKLAALPDDTDDDGGIESALMKLEGRYEKKSPSPNPSPSTPTAPEAFKNPGEPVYSDPSFEPSHHDLSQVRSGTEGDHGFNQGLNTSAAEVYPVHQGPEEPPVRRVLPVSSMAQSEDSFSSIPLLDRGLSDITYQRGQINNSVRSSANRGPPTAASPRRFRNQSVLASPGSSVEYVIETDSMKRIPRGGTVPRSSVPRESFLLDEDEDLSDMGNDGSTIGTRSDSTSHGVRSFFEDEPAVLDPEKEGLAMHPMRHPPTPPLTAKSLHETLSPLDTTAFQRGLPTPGPTPTSRFNNHMFAQTSQPVETAVELQELKKDLPQSPFHMPFILAYDSLTIAQQLTIVEKDALDEIDWKELIELRWKQSSPQIHDWVQYLRTQEPRGVDVVIARFNLVVKWAISECVLTESIEERARCIVKYIHIAAHARRLRNYATMYQITIALLSTDVSRLKKTWALIPAAEMEAMRELEALVQPVRNFHNLRVEMETASVEEGCIPFIGVYTRDLIYNAQKPAYISSPPVGGERLVNFERHHTAAMIVKSLLRLLEASSKYTFKPEPPILSRCLWLAALDDKEIIMRSRQCE